MYTAVHSVRLAYFHFATPYLTLLAVINARYGRPIAKSEILDYSPTRKSGFHYRAGGIFRALSSNGRSTLLFGAKFRGNHFLVKVEIQDSHTLLNRPIILVNRDKLQVVDSECRVYHFLY